MKPISKSVCCQFCVYTILLTASLALFNLSCERKNNQTNDKKWTQIGEPFDSISILLDKIWYDDTSKAKIDSLIRILSVTKTTDLQKRRYKYYKIRQLGIYNDLSIEQDTTIFSVCNHLLQGLDSNAYTYDYMRYKDLCYQFSHASLSEQYKFLNRLISFYDSTNDPLLKATAYNKLGNLLVSAGNNESAKESIKKAITLFNNYNKKTMALKLDLNNVLIAKETGSKEQAKQLLKNIISQNALFNDRKFAVRVFSLSYSLTGDVQYLYKGLAYNTISNRIPVRIAFHYLTTNMDSVRKYAECSYNRLKNPHTLEEEINALFLKYKVAVYNNETDSALYFADKYISAYDVFQEKNDTERLIKLNSERELRTMIENQKRKHVINSLFWIVGIIFLFIIFGILINLWKIKMKNLQILHIRRELELEKYRRQEAFTAICTQKNKIDTSAMFDEIDKLTSAKVIETDIAEDLKKKFRLHFSSDLEWDTISEAINQIEPEFQDYLRTKYPDITETLIRTAIYTLMGISGKRLAHILGIEYNSVKKRRYNLRKLLGIQTGESLEKKLIELNKESKRFPYL